MSEGRQQIGQARPQLGTMHDHVDGAMLKEELATLEAFRKLLADGLLDHARTGEADQRLGFADDHVAEHRQAGGNAAVDRVGQYRDERDAFFAQARQNRRGLGHLHQRDQRFLHARAAGGAHRTAHEGELEGAGDHRHALQLAAHGDQRVLLASVLLCRGEAILVLLAVAEFQAVHRLEVGTQLLATVLIEEDVQAGTRVDAHVVIALRADIQGLFQLRTVQHGFAGRAFVPQAFRYRTLLGLGTHDGRDQLVYQPVAHALCSPVQGRDGRTDPVTASLSKFIFVTAGSGGPHGCEAFRGLSHPPPARSPGRYPASGYREIGGRALSRKRRHASGRRRTARRHIMSRRGAANAPRPRTRGPSPHP